MCYLLNRKRVYPYGVSALHLQTAKSGAAPGILSKILGGFFVLALGPGGMGRSRPRHTGGGWPAVRPWEERAEVD